MDRIEEGTPEINMYRCKGYKHIWGQRDRTDVGCTGLGVHPYRCEATRA